MITWFWAGSRRGKSAYARSAGWEKRINIISQPCRCTRRRRKKVARHRRLRAGKGFVTIEQPRDIGEVDFSKRAQQAMEPPDRAGQNVTERPRCALLECMSNLVAKRCFPVRTSFRKMWLSDTYCRESKAISAKVDELVIVSNNVFEMAFPMMRQRRHISVHSDASIREWRRWRIR